MDNSEMLEQLKMIVAGMESMGRHASIRGLNNRRHASTRRWRKPRHASTRKWRRPKSV